MDSTGTSAESEVVVYVTPVNYKPIFNQQFPTQSINENVDISNSAYTVISNLNASDPDPVNGIPALVYRLETTAPAFAANVFAINGTGLFVTGALDYEAFSAGPRGAGTCDIRISVTDRNGEGEQAFMVVEVNVTDLQEPPVFPQSKYTRNVAENVQVGDMGNPITANDVDAADAGKLVYSITSQTPASPQVSIDSATGQLSYGASLDYEQVSQISIEVKVQDTDEPANEDSTTVVLSDKDPLRGRCRKGYRGSEPLERRIRTGKPQIAPGCGGV